ncbi:MAG: hypothetical protein HOP19_17020, partial [Acidobacteria bacterium]|nr:hypothetical protein [Acidobacteriota bacterium]
MGNVVRGTLLLLMIGATWYFFQSATKAQPQPNELEAALYQRAEFFGAQAVVPLPPAEARQRVAALQKRFPQDAAIQRKAAELDEALGRYDEAEAALKHQAANKPEALRTLADFYGRRAQFAQQAATLAELIERDEPSQLASNLSELLALARKHGLSQYLSAEFFQSAIARRMKSDDAGQAVFTVIEQYLAALSEQRRWPDIVAAVRSYHPQLQLPNHAHQLLLVEINALEKQRKLKEAEAVYDAAFDPFWEEEKLQAFYWSFLSKHDRLRAYGQELRAAFRREPVSFKTALRLYAYRKQMEDSASALRVFPQLEQARALRGQQWTEEELAVVARLMIANDEAEAAARYLYTLAQRGGLQAGHPLRAEVLHQLFRQLTEHADTRTPLTQGDLRFYEDVARSDQHPGLLGGVLSFVLSDTNPAFRLDAAETEATAYFNRTTAWRLFDEYKRERPTAPQLAQMYFALIKLFANSGDVLRASGLLKEFETRFADAPQRAEVALHLANYYQTHSQREPELAIYRGLLAHFSQQFKQRKAKSLLDVVEQRDATLLNDAKPEPITYQTILHRTVAALRQDQRANDILALYADAIKQHPDEAWLYDEFLTWLESANLTERQLAVYQDALQRFTDTSWTDRMARWFVRHERQQDFERLSRAALAKFDETQTENYLAQHLSHAAAKNAKAFDAQLYRALYQQAHERFPHSPVFVNGLLRYHEARNESDAWRALLAEHYWESHEWREMYLRHLSASGQLRAYLDGARVRVKQRPNDVIYLRFQADAAAWLSLYEEAVAAYRALSQSYPHEREFATKLVTLARSFGQQDAAALEEAARTQQVLADANPADAAARTVAGALYAEQADYARAAQEWNRLIALGAQDDGVWLEAATVFWDYYQYDEALRVLRAWRRLRNDDTLYAFQVGAILDSQHQTAAALGEYVKALDQAGDDFYNVRKRLTTLARRKGIAPQLHAAFLREAARSNHERRAALTLGYVDVLARLERWVEAAPLLRNETARSASSDFLESARDSFRSHNDAAGERLALERLTAHAKTTRFAISYRLQLVEQAARQKQFNEAQRHLQQLVRTYPNNYGEITEAADTAWQMGARDVSLRILRQAQGRALGRYRYQLARRIAAQESVRNQWSAAEKVLAKLHDEDPRNLDVFAELARVSVRTGHGAALRDRYRATIQAIKEQDELDRLEQRDRIAEVRTQVIEASTTLRDYEFAVEQHIEIINRNPDDEEKLETALRYCQRYGGCEKLIVYYSQTAKEAYKDYRWNLVLARLHGARRDFAQAVAQYQQAIHNQPEMIELHEALADAAVQAQSFDSAIAARRRACELTN